MITVCFSLFESRCQISKRISITGEEGGLTGCIITNIYVNVDLLENKPL